MRVELAKTFTFEAAHHLPYVPPDHKCRRLHGHSYRVEIVVRGEVNPELGWLMDFDAIRQAFEPIRLQLDHHYLNAIPGLENPTSEVLARWIWKRLVPVLPCLYRVSIAETCTSACHYYGEEADETRG
jgi:6-pyruvoyltetrahydropterin/6-carboxytetrahydropterin synthase